MQQQNTQASDEFTNFNLDFNINNTPIDKSNQQNAELPHGQIPQAAQPVDTQKIRQQIYKIKEELDSLLRLLNTPTIQNVNPTPFVPLNPYQTQAPETKEHLTYTGEQIIEGVFNGEKMIGPDGKEYAVPPNYASKSKLVEGDFMKLTITQAGKFIYKQIGPTPRKRAIGTLLFDEEKQLWFVDHNTKKYKILTASATFYRGKPGDEAVILIPEDGSADWGAVENIISH